MIPKTIHYCWFGRNKKPQLVNNCIESWKIHLPNYTIIEWNESNTKLNNEFVREAAKRKKWAFVADFIRFEVLFKNGGIYMDTDMFLIKNLDEFLFDKCFLGAEVDDYLNGAIIGAEKEHSFIEICMEAYNSLELVIDSDLINITLPKIITSVFRKNYDYNEPFITNREFQNIKIYSKEYFYPYPYRNHNEGFEIATIEKFIKPQSYAVHLWSGSWKEFDEFQLLVKKKYLLALKKIVKTIIKEQRISKKYIKELKLSFMKSFN